MASRREFPQARVSKSHYFLTLARGENMRCYAIRPWALYAGVGLFPLCGILYFSASMVYIMRDDVISAVYQRQQLMQQAYEDRLADMRAQVDRVSSRQLLDQNSLEGKMHELISRQAMLETRSAVVTQLAKSVGSVGSAKPQRHSALSAPLPPARPVTRTAQRDDDRLPKEATSYAGSSVISAPAARALGAVLSGRPKPHAVQVLSDENNKREKSRDKVSRLRDPYVQSIATDSRLPVELRIGALAQSLDVIEAQQMQKVAYIETAARYRKVKLRKAIAVTGLSPDKLRAPKRRNSATGGPFVPFKFDPNGPAFERAVLNLQKHLQEANRLQRIVNFIPVRRPLPQSASMSSNYGRRVDPFNGRIANHTGVDFREAYGAAVRSTGAGRVVNTGYHGGYGKMVEIDHGNGITSRYAHLSSINVNQGQSVGVGSVIGKIGSTGRSTGPHLHYEVRIHDNPVNPIRFIRAGRALKPS
jgi:murein DD-endopeptidase MepM/ murein hydrolase activator NlpD